MLRISTKTSVTISIILSVLFFALILAGAFLMPNYVAVSLKYPAERLNITPSAHYFTVLALGYAVLAVATAANVMLLRLLFRVRSEQVFTSESISLIRFISWCVVLLGMVFLVLGFYFFVSYFVAFACIFLGICLRVVKNVIEQATEIKAENDFTI